MKFTSLAALASALAGTSLSALASPLMPRDVFVPPILYPHADTVWTVGQRHNVTWDTSNAPKQITNGKGMIMLRFENLTTPVILANNFNILLGRIEVTVPTVVDSSEYQLVLFGDSGNFSPFFTIQGSGVDF